MKSRHLAAALAVQLLNSALLAEVAEVKMLIAEERRVEAMGILGVKADGEPETWVCFFDTPDTTLDKHKLILRVRLDTKAGKSGKKDADAIVKLRGAAHPPQGYEALKPELDWTGPASSKPSYSIKAENLSEAETAQVLDGMLPLEKVLTADQMRFASACLQVEGGKKMSCHGRL